MTLRKLSKVELTGILVPWDKVIQGEHCKFKLESDSGEYFLAMNDSLDQLAKILKWDKVNVKGLLNSHGNLVTVEKMKLADDFDGENPEVGAREAFELDQYRRTIYQLGKIDLAPEYLAS